MENGRQLLHELPLLSFVAGDVRKLVVDSFVPLSFTFGQPIVTEGASADAFYVLASGTARVVKTGPGGEEISLGLMRPGESFGEIGLLEETTRSATIRASGDVHVFRLDRAIFEALVHGSPELRGQI